LNISSNAGTKTESRKTPNIDLAKHKQDTSIQADPVNAAFAEQPQ